MPVARCHRSSPLALWSVAMLMVFAFLIPAAAALAKPPVTDLPGEVLNDATPRRMEKRALHAVMVEDRAALAALYTQRAAATDEVMRDELELAIQQLKFDTRVRLLDVQIEHARLRGDRARLSRLESRRMQRAPAGRGTGVER